MDFFFTNVAYADGVDKFIMSVNQKVLNPVIMLLFAVAFVYFLWGVSQMILEEHDARYEFVRSARVNTQRIIFPALVSNVL